MRDGCTSVLVMGLALLLVALVAIKIGYAPSMDTGNGFNLFFDPAPFVARQQQETERERIRQQEETERAEEWNDTLRTGALCFAAAAVAIVWTVQHNRTRRKAIEALALLDAARPSMPPQQIANIYINTFLPNGTGRIVDVNGIPMIADAQQRRLIPLDVARQRLADARLLPGPHDPPP